MNNLPTTQLWLGNHATLIKKVEEYFCSLYCTQQSCLLCITCTQIMQHEYHAIHWISPEKYTLATLAPVTDGMYQLAPHQQVFFIFCKADFLPAACQNRLLKTIEEPATGYHFIFLASTKERLLPTIISRCLVKEIRSTHASATTHSLIDHFTKKQILDTTAFLQLIEHNAPSEQESMELLNAITSYWLAKYLEQSTQARTVLRLLEEITQEPISPGSSKLFWKALYIQWHQIKL